MKPLGSLIRESTPVTGRFHATDDFDLYTLVVEAGQTVSLRFTPSDASLRGSVELLGPDGTTSFGSTQAVNPGDTILLQTVPAATAGTYTIKLSRLAGSGAYQVVTTLNAALETEQFGGATNNVFSAAQDIIASAVALQGTANRFAITGKTEVGQDDYYQFDLAAGQAATIVLATADANAMLSVELRDGNNVLVGAGIKETVNAEQQAIRNFMAPAAGTYYVRVSGEVNHAYSVVVTKSAELDREPNSAAATVQDIRLTGQVLGRIDATDTQDQYLVAVNAGDVLTITTTTPGGSLNTLNPKIELYGPSGTTPLVTDLNGAVDGRNARIADFTATTAGLYRVVVGAESGAGEYTLAVTGATGAPSPFTIVDQSVPNGDLRTSYPTTFRVDLSEICPTARSR